MPVEGQKHRLRGRLFISACLNNIVFVTLIYFVLIFWSDKLPCTEAKRATNDSTNPGGNNSQKRCTFPESVEAPFFFDLASDTPIQTVILDSVVKPPNARVSIANVRSNNLPKDVNMKDLLNIESFPDGKFRLINKKLFPLPEYPSTINETLLFVTILCNGNLHPLITLRVQNTNTHSPEFFGLPYELTISKGMPANSLIPTAILALDRDPAETYTLSFSISPPDNDKFALELDHPASSSKIKLEDKINVLPKEYPHVSEQWRAQQLPPTIKLRLLTAAKNLKNSVYYLNISATDNGFPERRSHVLMKVLIKEEIQGRFTSTEYFANVTKDMNAGDEVIPNEAIIAEFSTTIRNEAIEYTFNDDEEFSQYFTIDATTGRVYISRKLPEDFPEDLKLTIKARLLKEDSKYYVTSKLSLTDATEIRLTYFTQCHYEVHLLENPSAYTRVMQFTYRGDVAGIELLEGNELFTVDPDGTMFVRPGVDIDREKVQKLTARAKLKSKFKLHPKSLEFCQISTVDITIDDFNDHTPKFVRKQYQFRIDAFPFNNTEVGTLMANDDDKGEFGRVRYRIYEIYTGEVTQAELPFVLFQADGVATIFYVFKDPTFIPQPSYIFNVDAYDSDDDPRSSRVVVHVRLHDLKEGEKDENVERDDRVYLKRMQMQSSHPSDFSITDEPFGSGNVGGFSSTDSSIIDSETPELVELSTVNDEHLEEGIGDSELHPLPTPALDQPIKSANAFNIDDAFGENFDDKTILDTKLEPIHEQSSFLPENAKNSQNQPEPKITDQSRRGNSTKSGKENGEPGNENTETSPNRSLETVATTNASKKQFKNFPKKKLIVEGEKWTAASIPDEFMEQRPLELNRTDSLWKFPGNYTFEIIGGPLDVGQYIGTVRASQMESLPLSVDINREPRRIEYAIEEGIANFVEIHPHTGKLSIGPRLLEDNFEELRFSVAAQNPHTGELLVTTFVTVFIDDTLSVYSGSGPTFENELYRFDVEENQSEQQIGRLEAHHRAVEFGKDKIFYTFDKTSMKEQQTNLESVFRIDRSTGALSNIVPLDAERQKNYRFGVRACLESNDSICGYTEVVVFVIDVNDNAPSFSQPEYKVRLPAAANLYPGIELFHANATDNDSGPLGYVHYTLRAPSSFQDLFSIDSTTGIISLTEKLAPEENGGATAYRIEIDATDEGEPPLSSSASVQFILDSSVNPHSPSFEKFRYEIIFRGDGLLKSETLVGRIHAVDQDNGNDGAIHYRFVFDNQPREDEQALTSDDFSIDSQTGEIRTTADLFFERLDKNSSSLEERQFQIVAEATDGSQLFPRKAQTIVLVKYPPTLRHLRESRLALDVPKIEFIPLPKTIFLALGKPVKSIILRLSLRTVDTTTSLWRPFLSKLGNWEIKYTVTEEPINLGLFEMINNQMVVRRHLRAGEYSVIIRAEILRKQDKLGRKQVVASIQHQMNVIVMAEGRDKYPVFQRLNYEFEISTDAKLPFKLQSLNATLSKGRISYNIYPLKEDEPVKGLAINANSGQITVFQDFLDTYYYRDKKDDQKRALMNNDMPLEIFVVVRAINLDSPQFYSDAGVGIVLVDHSAAKVSKKSLSFTSAIYKLILQENSPVGTILRISEPPISINDREKHQKVHYQLSGDSDLLQHFDLLENQSIVLRKPLDPAHYAQSNGITNLTIIANDGGNLASAHLQIIFARDKPRLNEGSDQKGSEVNTPKSKIRQMGTKTWHPSTNLLSKEEEQPDGLVINAPQHTAWEFRIAKGNELGHYELEQLNSTAAQLLLAEEVDGISTPSEDVVVEAINEDDPSEILITNIHVDFSSRDSSFENQRSFTVTSASTSRGQETIMVQLNDGKPNNSDVKSNLLTPIFSVEKQEKSSKKVRYVLLSENPMFRLDPETGELFLNETKAKNITIQDFELLIRTDDVDSGKALMQKLYNVRLTPSVSTPASQSLEIASTIPTIQSTEATLEISMTSSAFPDNKSVSKDDVVQFNPSHYHFVVEKPIKDGLIGQLGIINLQNKPINSMVIEPLAIASWFRIDPRTAMIFLREVPLLNGRQRADFQVSFADPSSSEQKSIAFITVDLNLPTTTTIAKVESTAPAETEINNVSTIENRSFEETNIAEKSTTTNFFVETSTLMSVDEDVTDYAASEDYREEQESIDGDLMTSAQTTQRIRSTEAPTLRFPFNKYSAMLPEGRYGSLGVQLSLKPQPLSEGMPQGLVYSIIDSPAQFPFFVHSDSGELIAFDEIDREKNSAYNFRVKVTDKEKQNTAETSIHVEILDVNDNYPEFIEPLIRVLAVDRNTPVGKRLGKFLARDADAERLGQVIYRLEGEEGNHYFKIDGSKGDLYFSNPIPPNAPDVFNITIVAMDGGRPALRTEHMIRIEVFDNSANNYPKFKQKEYFVERDNINEPKNDTFIAQIVAGTGSNINYLLADSSDKDPLFKVIPNTGEIRLARKPHEHELNKEFILNISASNENGSDFEIVHIFLDNSLMKTSLTLTATSTVATNPSVTKGNNSSEVLKRCSFAQSVFNAEMEENVQGKHLLTTLHGNKDCSRLTRYAIVRGSSDAFELNPTTGDLFAVKPLDREQKSVYFIIANITSGGTEAGGLEILDTSSLRRRPKRQSQTRLNSSTTSPISFNAVLERAKSQLQQNQAVVTVRVLDQNDNAPEFLKLNPEGRYVFSVDWQAPVLHPIGWVQALDKDERSQLNYSILHQSNARLVSINSTSGALYLARSMHNEPDDEFDIDVLVSDGTHNTTASVKLYKLQPGINLVLLDIDQPLESVDELKASRILTAALSKEHLDAFVLVKQVWIGPDGMADARRTHLLVWAQDHQTKVPLEANHLKSLLDNELSLSSKRNESNNLVPGNMASLVSTLKLASVFVPDYSEGPNSPMFLGFTRTDLVIVAVATSLVLMACCLMLLILHCCKKKQHLISKEGVEYMVNSHLAGPRPYNVQLITRKTAQEFLTNRPLPEPKEERTLSSESRAALIASSGIYKPNDPRLQKRTTAPSDEVLESSSHVPLNSTKMDRMPSSLHPYSRHVHTNQAYETESSAGMTSSSSAPSGDNSPEGISRNRVGANTNHPNVSPPLPPLVPNAQTFVLRKTKEATDPSKVFTKA